MDMMSPTECLLQMCDEHFSLEDYQSGVPRWCTGCGDNAILAAVQRPHEAPVELVQGFVRSAGGDSQITVGCYLYDVALKSELTRQGYVVQPRDWRRAAPACSPAPTAASSSALCAYSDCSAALS